MSSLENAVERLAASLDTLESRLQARLQDLAERSEDVESLRAKAGAAKIQAAAASAELASVINDLKTLADAESLQDAPRKRAAGE